MGYHLAGFDVVGVDIEPQPNYPFAFIQADAIEYLKAYGHEYDAIHASPPCQAYSNAQRIQQREHPELIGPTRSALVALGRPWVIENVPGAPMHDAIKLCGTMFGLRTYRHRLFEASFELIEPEHPEHTTRQAKMGRPIGDGEFIQVVGNFSNADLAREVMGMPWATRDELREAIPTAYTRFIGEQLLAYLRRQPLQEKGRPMGNTLDMAKIKEDHQARNERLMLASASAMAASQNYTDETMLECYAAMLTELAAIWREEANRLSELPSPKPRGWKTTMESLRDCATRVSGVAVAMRNHGLPGDDDSGPKETRTTAGASTLANGAQAAALPAAGVQLDQAQPTGESCATEKPTDADPKASTDSPSPTKSPAIPTSVSAANGSTTAIVQTTHPSDDPAGDFLRDLNRGESLGDRTYAEMSTFKAMIGTNTLEEESLAEAASAIIEQVRAKDGAPTLWSSDAAVQAGFSPDPGPVTVTYDANNPTISADTKENLEKAAGAFYMNSGGALDTSPKPDRNTMTVTWRDGVTTTVGVIPQAGHEVITPGAFGEGGTVPLTLGIGGPVIGEAQWSIGAADAPPAWAALPEVPRFELDSPMALDSPGHISVSQANMVSECALKWKLAKRHGAPERPGWALVGGKAFHQVVQWIEEGFDGGSLVNMTISAETVNIMWKRAFGQAIEQTQAENPLFPIATWHASNKGKEDRAWWDADGPEMVHHYLAWRAKWVADGWELLRTADGRPVVELEFLAFLSGSPVKGFIDSGWYHAGRNMIAIIDWKSGTSKPADYFQQATYRHALEPLLGEPTFTAQVQWLGAFWDARSGELGPLVDLDVRHPKAEVEMRLSMPRRIDAAGLYMPNVNTGYGGCGSCSLKRSCPVGSRIGTGEVKL